MDSITWYNALIVWLTFLLLVGVWLVLRLKRRADMWKDMHDTVDADNRHYIENYKQMTNKAVRLENTLSDRELQLQRSKQSGDDLRDKLDGLENQITVAKEEHARLTTDRDEWRTKAREANSRLVAGSKKYELTANVVEDVNGKKLALELMFVDNEGKPHAVIARELVKNHRNNAELSRVAASINYKIKRLVG